MLILGCVLCVWCLLIHVRPTLEILRKLQKEKCEISVQRFLQKDTNNTMLGDI